MMTSVAPAHPTSLRLNNRQIGDRKIEVWTTRIGGRENLLPVEQVEMLKADTRDRLLPLCRELTRGMQIFAGGIYDPIDETCLEQMESFASLDDAIVYLQAQGASAKIIDSLHEEGDILSIGFLQIQPFGTGYKEHLGCEKQFIHALAS